MRSVQQIRLRLLMMLGRAFLGSLLFLVFLFPLLTAYILTNYSDSGQLHFPLIGTLEGYYQGRGNWDDVENTFQIFDEFPADYTLLLDADQRIILEGGEASASRVGTRYEMALTDVSFPLYDGDQKIGVLVIRAMADRWRGEVAKGILIPVAGISFFLGLFVVVIGFLLMRRFVNPLADVIFAARAVADGKLNTRIATEGPQDLNSLAESFNEMADSLERNDQTRRDMLADIAHELRTPLSVIRGRLEGIVDGIYAADADQVSLALEPTYLLERLVDDLHLLTLVERRQLPLEIKKVDLAQLSRHILDVFSAQAQDKGITLSLENGAGDYVADLDLHRMEQVIGNLVGNSLRYVPDGGKIWIALENAPGDIRLCINDNGPGVQEHDLPFLFDRFWRKDKSRARNAGGTGLGLAITKQLVEAQGGSIQAANLPGGGLQVTILFKR